MGRADDGNENRNATASAAWRIMLITPEPVANDDAGNAAVPTAIKVGNASPTPMPAGTVPSTTMAPFDVSPMYSAQIGMIARPVWKAGQCQANCPHRATDSTRSPSHASSSSSRLTAIGLVLTVCGSGRPLPVTYVLGPPPVMSASTQPLIGQPVVEVKPVLLPDYLDVSDLMMRRSDNVVAPSARGGAGEGAGAGSERGVLLGHERRQPCLWQAVRRADERLDAIDDPGGTTPPTRTACRRWRRWRSEAKASGRTIVRQMKAMPTDDPLFGKGTVRADGRVLHPMYLFQVKSPAESKYPWDYYKLVRSIDAAHAFRPIEDGHCPLVHG